MAKGWIRLHRQIQECGIWKDKEPFDRRSAWLDLLLMANYEEKTILIKNKPVTIERGQRFTSTLHLAERWHWSVNRVRRYLALLETLQMVTTDRTSNGITITIVKYGDYQIERITDELANETSNGITDETTDGITGGIQVKNIKKERNINIDVNKKHIYGEYKNVRLTDAERDRLFSEFGEEKTNEAIQFLDEYKQRKGYKCKDDNLTLRKWVFRAVQEEKGKGNAKSKTGYENKRDYNYSEIENLLRI